LQSEPDSATSGVERGFSLHIGCYSKGWQKLQRGKFAHNSEPVPMGVAGTAKEAKGVQENTPQPGLGESVHIVSFLNEGEVGIR
jgi:hypothetical protein